MYNQAKSVLGKNRTALILIKERYILMLFLPLKHSQNAVFYRGNRHFCKRKDLETEQLWFTFQGLFTCLGSTKKLSFYV